MSEIIELRFLIAKPIRQSRVLFTLYQCLLSHLILLLETLSQLLIELRLPIIRLQEFVHFEVIQLSFV